jgi:hypothetical protein
MKTTMMKKGVVGADFLLVLVLRLLLLLLLLLLHLLRLMRVLLLLVLLLLVQLSIDVVSNPLIFSVALRLLTVKYLRGNKIEQTNHRAVPFPVFVP